MTAPDPARSTNTERFWYEQGLLDGKNSVAGTGHTWSSTEFILIALVLLWGMWAGYYAITHSDVELPRWLGITGAVFTLAGAYLLQRTQVKKAIVESTKGANQ